MKELKDYVKESILDDIEDQLDNTDEIIKRKINNFIEENYTIDKISISDKPNANGKYEVSATSIVIIRNNLITSLTNNMFIWHKIKGDFSCARCSSLKSLEGAPQMVEGYFNCRGCSSLKTLEGAPKKVKSDFYCYECNSLQTLKGAPKEVGGSFNCEDCINLKSLKGSPVKVGRSFFCRGCSNLISLEGAPKEVGNAFYCDECKVKFTEDDVKKVSNVKDEIYC